MINFLAIYLAVPVLAGWLLTFPVGAAYLAGIRSARDPTHRLTDRGAWFFFDHVIERRLRAWRWVWLGAFVLGVMIPLILFRDIRGFPSRGNPTANLGLCLIYAEIGLSTGLLVYTSLVLLAPRFEELGWLMAACLGISLFVLSPILFAGSIVYFRAMSSRSIGLRYFIFGFPFFPVQVLVLAMVLRSWARARGDHWFRMKT